MNVRPSCDDGQEPAGIVDQAAHAAGAGLALLDELVDAAPANRHERDLGRDEEALEEGQEDQEQDLAEREAHDSGGSVRLRCARGSRIRAGTPTASLPGGHVLRDDGARAGPRALADLDRGDEHRVDAQEGVRPDAWSGSWPGRPSWR